MDLVMEFETGISIMTGKMSKGAQGCGKGVRAVGKREEKGSIWGTIAKGVSPGGGSWEAEGSNLGMRGEGRRLG